MMQEGECSQSPKTVATMFKKRAATLEDLHALSGSERANEWGLGSARIRASELKFSRDDVIARGHHGIVYKGWCRGSPVAIKMLRNQNLSRKELKGLQREAEIMRSLRHPSVLLLMGVCTERRSLAIVTEHVVGRDLGAMIHDESLDMTLRQKLHIAKGIAQGMNWLHCLPPEPILHNDLKPSNVMITKEGNVKLCDFGLSSVREKFDPAAPLKDTVSGTAFYLAPELIEGVPASEKSDVYAFAILLWELFTRTKPYAEHDFESISDLYRAVVKEHQRPALILPPAAIAACPRKSTSMILALSSPRASASPSYSTSSSSSSSPSLSLSAPTKLGLVPHEAVASLLADCWQSDRFKRPSFADILERLDDIVVDTILADPISRALWKELRGAKSSGQCMYPWTVPWPRFVEAYHSMARPDLPLPLYVHSTEVRCARLLLAAESEDITRGSGSKEYNVLLESFGRFVHLHGPFRRSILQDFDALCKRGCFHGMIDAREAERRLGTKKKRKGFLLRLSARDPASLTISRRTKDGYQHTRAQRTQRGWNVPIGRGREEVACFPSLAALLDSSLARKSGKKGLGLKRPCTRDSEFAAVHMTEARKKQSEPQYSSDDEDHSLGYDGDEQDGDMLAPEPGHV